jgi:putative oxygen-independent coproporphyrinogen III oxidase
VNAVIPLSLYIHFPWCVQKCPYCDFNSHAVRQGLDDQAYVDALLADLDMQLPQIWGRPVRSIFFGGGTPSLMSGSAMLRLMSELRARLNLGPEVEITLEANPGAIDSGHFHDYAAAGINRLSLGIQSMDNGRLQALGRIHNVDDALSAIATARSAGLENINLDLMFGLPGQSPDAAMAELEQVLATGPTHLSYYQLTIEPNTLFQRHPPMLPHEDVIDEIHEAGIGLLARHGFRRYEISAYAHEGNQCRHNLNYWLYGDYLGIGAGAHSKLSSAETGTIRRFVKQKHPEHYLQAAGRSESVMQDELVGREDRGFEFMMNALRLTEGFKKDTFIERTGLPWSNIADIVDNAAKDGLLTVQDHTIQPTETGLRFLNDLLTRFLPD